MHTIREETMKPSSHHLYPYPSSSHHYHHKCSVYVIIFFLMMAIIAVSFYEPRWIHNQAFLREKEKNNQLGLNQIVPRFNDVLDLREIISEAAKKAKLSKALQSIPIQAEHLVYDSVKVTPSFPFSRHWILMFLYISL